QKLSVARDVLTALAHAHAHEVLHRALTPATILVGRDGRVSLTGFDFARAGTERSHTIAGEIVDELDTHYGSVLKVEMRVDLRALIYIKTKRYGIHVRAYLHI